MTRHWHNALCDNILAGALGAVLLLGITAELHAANGELELRVVDEDTNQLVPARMHLKDQRGRPVKQKRLPFWNDHFVMPGKVVLDLRPGTYTFELERGPEYRVHTGSFTIKQGDADNKQVSLSRFVDMKDLGWWSGDLHIHRDARDIELLMLAEDLHVAPLITWWNEKNTWTKQPPPKDILVQFDEDRFYHLMGGEDERGGGALLYFNLEQPLPITGSEHEYPSSCRFLVTANKQPGVHVDIEKPFWWDMPTWVASRMVDSMGICHNHMQRDGVLANEAWGKAREKIEYPGAHGNGHWTQDLYYRLLNCGLRLPPSAGSASGVLENPVGYNRVYVYCGKQLDYATWWENLRAGKVVVTNGPLLQNPRVNGELPGHVFEALLGETLQLQAAFSLSTRDKIDYLEVIKNGEVVHEVRLDQWAKAGGKLPPVAFEQSGWMLVRAITNHPRTFRFASTGPYYVQIGDQRRISRSAAQFFLDWVHERAGQIRLPDADQRNQVIQYHRAARDYWQKLVEMANAD